MDWHFETELISLVLLGIIWVYSHENNMVRTLRNRIFRGCFSAILLSILINIIDMVMLQLRPGISPAVLLAGRELHHVTLPLVTLMGQLYLLAYVNEKAEKKFKRPLLLSLIPYGIYELLVLTNPLTGLLFTVDQAGQFMNGPLVLLAYLIHYAYLLIMCGTVIKNKKYVSRENYRVLIIIPLYVALIVFIQQFFTNIVLSGIASVSVLLFAYLYLQNKRISEDQLTALPNRTAYLQMLEYLIQKKQSFIVMNISLNDFKFINDKFGQDNGDLFIKKISVFLKTIGPEKGVYRFGGDKFAVLFENQRVETAAVDINRIAERFTKAWEVSDCSCHIGAAIGVAQYPASADTCGELVSMLESAVERAKYSGSTQPVFCDREIIEQVRRRHTLYELIRSAIQDDRIEVYYQPLFSIAHDRFTEAEALLRIRDESGKFLSPEEFVPIAEETGLIIEIGYIVLQKVCEYIRSLLQRGIEIDTVSVNLSVAQMMKPDFVPRALQIIRASGISPSRIIFEITESILVSNYTVISEKTKKLSDAGIGFALDDFGTGYSNLTHVIDLPFDVVKIDKSLIWDSMNNSKCYIMVRDMAKIFQNMNLMVTAEGVETTDHDRFARLCGCSRIQGFRYARPQPGADAEKYFGRTQLEIAQ